MRSKKDSKTDNFEDFMNICLRTIPLYNHMLSLITHVGCLLAIFVSLMGQLNLNWVMWSSATHDYLVEVTELQLKLKYSSTEIDKVLFEDEIIAVEDKG